MRNNASFLYSFFLIVGDFIAILTAFVAAYIIRVQIDTRALANPIPAMTYFKIFLVILPFWLIIFALLGLYNKDIYERRFHEFVRLFIGCVVGVMSIITIDFLIDRPLFPGRLIPIYALLVGFALLLIERTLLRFIRRQFFTYGRGVNNVLIIGSNSTTTDIARLLAETRQSGYRVVAMHCAKQYIPAGLQTHHFATLEEALDSLDRLRVHSIIQTELYADESKNQQIFDAAQTKHIAYKFIPTHSTLLTGSNSVELFHNFPVIAVHQTPLIGWGRIAKRLFDFVAAVIGLIIAAPVMLVLAIIIKATDWRYPVFYKHPRVTRYGTTFNVYKLRSMYGKWSPGLGAKKTDVQIFKEMGRDDLVDEWQRTQKVKKDPRIMPIGRFTRRTGLDELPQLWNVIKGDLSLIGPRAITRDELTRYEKASSLFLSVKPGITGLWQVSGRNSMTYEERIGLELFYVQNWSFLLDLKIAYRTVLVMLKARGQ